MKAILFISTVLVAVGCESQPDQNTETWWINSAKVACTGVGPMTCLQIQKEAEIDPESWEFFYSTIEDFIYEPGNIYQIKVKITDKAAPVPADASSKNYKLIEIMSKETGPVLRLTTSWKVTQVGETANPIGFKNEEALIFEFDASKKTYVGNMGCNSIRGAIKENDGEKLVFYPGAATEMACPQMTTEQAISKALIDTRGYKLENNQLYLLNQAGKTLITFQAVD